MANVIHPPPSQIVNNVTTRGIIELFSSGQAEPVEPPTPPPSVRPEVGQQWPRGNQ